MTNSSASVHAALRRERCPMTMAASVKRRVSVRRWEAAKGPRNCVGISAITRRMVLEKKQISGTGKGTARGCNNSVVFSSLKQSLRRALAEKL
jgi:hypothetical protein